MSPFKLLGVAADADEPTIKRAYAKRLKTTRPDEDPAAFQRLYEAYQSALERCRARGAMALDDAGGEDDGEAESFADAGPAHEVVLGREQLEALLGMPLAAEAPPRPIDLPASAPEPGTDSTMDSAIGPEMDPVATWTPDETFDFAAFFAAVLAQSRARPRDLAAWLGTREDLYHLGLKQAVGEALFQRLMHEEVVLAPGQVEVLCEFFGMPRDYWLEQRMAVRWAVREEDTRAYDEPRPLAIRQLKRRFQWPQALMVACVPGLAGRIGRMASQLEDHHGDLPAGIDARQAEFFGRLSQPDYFGPWIWLPMLLRAGMLAWLAATVIPWAATRPFDPLHVALYTAAGAMALQFGLRVGVWLHRITEGQSGSGHMAQRLLPVWLALAAVLLDLALPDALDWPAWLPAIAAAALHWRRTFDALRFLLGGFAMAAALADTLPALSPFTVALAMVPIGISLFDGLYARQHGLPLQAAVGNPWTRIASYGFLIGWIAFRWLPGG